MSRQRLEFLYDEVIPYLPLIDILRVPGFIIFVMCGRHTGLCLLMGSRLGISVGVDAVRNLQPFQAVEPLFRVAHAS